MNKLLKIGPICFIIFWILSLLGRVDEFLSAIGLFVFLPISLVFGFIVFGIFKNKEQNQNMWSQMNKWMILGFIFLLIVISFLPDQGHPPVSIFTIPLAIILFLIWFIFEILYIKNHKKI